MEALEISLSFLISYIAGNVPSIKDLLEINTSLEEKLEKCFKKAVSDWDVDPETKKMFGDNMPRYLIHLKEFLSHTPKGHHPKENELLRLWADYIISDADCSAFILKHQQDIIQMDIQRGFQRAEDILCDLKSAMDEEFQRVQEKLDWLLKRGVYSCSDYWDRYSTIDTEKKLPQSIILCGREDIFPKITGACNNPSLLNIESETQKESLAFACAVVLSLGKDYSDRAYVVEDTGAYKELSVIDKPLIIITSILENHAIAVKNRHTVLCCVSHQDRLQNTIRLGEIDRDGFVDALKDAGYDEAKARTMARDTSRDINNFWRAVGIVTTAPTWEDNKNIRLLIPAMLLGEWSELVKNDCDIVSQLSKMPYDDYMRELHLIIAAEESPLTKIGGIWKIRSPYNLMRRFFRDITEEDIKAFLKCADWLIEDDDPDAVDKMDADSLKFWKDKHAFSDALRSGVFQGITLLALLQEENLGSSELIRNFFQQKLDSFGLVRYLSNRNYLQLVAEAVPSEFLCYIQSNMRDDSELLKEIFEVRQRKYDIVGTSIYYTDLLFCLENLAWDEHYLSLVTDILLYLCKYPNESNWANKPINSLMEIYRFRLPQTYATFDQRMDILHNLSGKYPDEVRILCFKELKGISSMVFTHTSQFKWRWMERQFTPKYIESIPAEYVQRVVDLMLQLTQWTNDDICDYLELSSNDYMRFSRDCLLAAISEHKDQMKGNDLIVETLRKDIKKHRSCKKAKWALNDEELKPYVNLLSEIESEDIVIRNKHCFDELLLEELDFDNVGYEKRHEDTLQYRVSIIDEIIGERGIEGVFQLSRLSKQSSTIAEALVKLNGGKYTNEIYKGVIKTLLPEQFVRSYFFHLYFEIGNDTYLTICDTLLAVSENHIAVVLYAPEFKRELADRAEKLGDNVSSEYWKNVTLWRLSESDIPLIQMRLKSIGRYEDLLTLMTHGSVVSAFSSEDKVSLLLEMFRAGFIENMIRNAYHIATLLKTIDLPTEKVQRDGILQIEFLMYNHLRHYIHGESLHFVKEIQSSPELMIELVELQYLPDKEFRQEEDSKADNSNKVAMARLAFDFFYHYHSVPGLQPDGKLDYAILNEYINHLQELAISHHRVHVMPLVIGKMIGDIPESDNYPSDEMCELIEKLADDEIDNQISCAIANRRGMSSRSLFEGGTVERKHIDTLNKYRERALGKSQRMVKILSNEIRSFEVMAKREDEMAEIRKLKY